MNVINLFESIYTDNNTVQYIAYPNSYVLESLSYPIPTKSIKMEYIDVPIYEVVKDSPDEVIDQLNFDALSTLMAASVDRNIIVYGPSPQYAIQECIKMRYIKGVSYTDFDHASCFISNQCAPDKCEFGIKIDNRIWNKVMKMYSLDYNNMAILVDTGDPMRLVSPVRTTMKKIDNGYMSARGIACLSNTAVCLIRWK